MPFDPQMIWSNKLLQLVPGVEAKRIRDMTTRITCSQLDILQSPEREIKFVYFPESGWVSVVASLSDGRSAEVGIIGREGMVGLDVLDGGTVASFEWIVQAPGVLLRMGVDQFRLLLQASQPFTTAVHEFALSFHRQVGQTAACNVSHTVDQRLAKWLLMARERSDSDVLSLTHELLSIMLGVRRAGVSVAANHLRASNCIEYSSGSINIKNREFLEKAACGCYQAVRLQRRPDTP